MNNLDLQILIDEFKPYGPDFLVWWLLTDKIRWLEQIQFSCTEPLIRAVRRERRKWIRDCERRAS